MSLGELPKASPASWISSILPETGSNNQEITITYEKNTTFTSREAILTLSATESGATETLRITLTQASATVVGLPTLAEDLRFYPNPASQTLYIEGISQETEPYYPHIFWKDLVAYHFEPK